MSGRRPAQEDPRMSAMLTQQQRATDALSIECRRYFGGAVVCDGQRGHLQSHGTEGFDRPVLYPTVTIVMRKAAAFESVSQCRVLARQQRFPTFAENCLWRCEAVRANGGLRGSL